MFAQLQASLMAFRLKICHATSKLSQVVIDDDVTLVCKTTITTKGAHHNTQVNC